MFNARQIDGQVGPDVVVVVWEGVRMGVWVWWFGGVVLVAVSSLWRNPTSGPNSLVDKIYAMCSGDREWP